MLVIFNTAYRPGYMQNVLKTMFLPANAINEFRYSIGETSHISEDIIESIEKLGACEVLICYGDRYSSGGYTFYPFRKGRLEGVVKSGGRAYIRVRLSEYVAAINPVEFTAHLRDISRDLTDDDRLLCLTDGQPECAKDGRYAFLTDEDFGDFLECGDRSWRTSSEQISRTRAFESTANERYVFSRCELVVDGCVRKYEIDGEVSRFEFSRNQDARFVIYYYYPIQGGDRDATDKVSISSGEAVDVVGSKTHMLDMPENRLIFPLAFEPHSDKSFSSIDVEFISSSDVGKIHGVRESVAIKIHQSPVWLVLSLVFVLFYIIGAICTAADEKIVGEIIKSVAVACMILGLGKKLV